MPAEGSQDLQRTFPVRLLLVALAIVIVFGIFIAAPHSLTLANLLNLLRQVALNGIIASGMTVVMVGGGFDLSVGAMAALAGVLSIRLASHSLVGSVIVPVLAGSLAGFVNGLLITRWTINPLIATLGSRYVLYATANLATSGFIQVNRNPEFATAARSWKGFPIPAVVFLAIAASLYMVLRHSTWGARLYATGSNERAALFSGIRAHRIRIQAYALCSACAALAGVVLAMRSGAAAPDAGSGYELDAIAAAVVGGVSIFGGSGGLLNTLTGVLFLGILSNVLVLARETYEVQRIVMGIVIVIAIALDRYRKQ